LEDQIDQDGLPKKEFGFSLCQLLTEGRRSEALAARCALTPEGFVDAASSLLSSPPFGVDLSFLGVRLDSLVRSRASGPLFSLPPVQLLSIVQSGLTIGRISAQREVQLRLVKGILERARVNRDYLSVLPTLNFENLTICQLREVLELFPRLPNQGQSVRNVVRSIITIRTRATDAVTEAQLKVAAVVPVLVQAEVDSIWSESVSKGLSPGARDDALRKCHEEWDELKLKLDAPLSEVIRKSEDALTEATRCEAETVRIRDEIGLLRVGIGAEAERSLGEVLGHRKNCGNILSVCGGRWKVMSSPTYKQEELRLVVSGAVRGS
jgi:hypothetical protein